MESRKQTIQNHKKQYSKMSKKIWKERITSIFITFFFLSVLIYILYAFAY